MLYKLLRLPLIILFFSFYRRIYWAGAKNVPKGVPIVIISNHSTACAEQMLVAAFLRRGVYFWARSGVFTNIKVIQSLLKAVHMLPIKRTEDGLKNASENNQTFEESYQQILSGKALYVAPEGNCVMEKRLRAFRTGSARVALGAAASVDFKEPVAIVPVGVNYTHHRFFRSDVMISFGEPIYVKDFEEEYRNDPQRAAKMLTNSMKEAVLKEVVSIDKTTDEELVEQLFEVYRNDTVSPIGPRFSRNNERLRMEQCLAKTVNHLEDSEKESLATESNAYFQTLQANELTDSMFATHQKLNFSAILMLALGFLPALLGLILGWIPLNMARYFRNRLLKTEHSLQFWAPLAIALVFATWIGYSLLLITATAFSIGWWSWALPVVFAGLQFWQILYKDFLMAYLKQQYFSRMKVEQPQLMATLSAKRMALIQHTDGLIVQGGRTKKRA
jgi:glycerol-3-phosphate O-acyltransferase/dihydroxyacetone phosphate acyltransferase